VREKERERGRGRGRGREREGGKMRVVLSASTVMGSGKEGHGERER